MKKHILFSLLLVAGLSLAACSKAKKEEAVEGEATEESAVEETAVPSGDAITMLDHLKAANTKICETLVNQKPGKTVEECTAELNKLSELNPQNTTTTVSKAASQKCIDSLGAVGEGDVMVQSTQGDCALSVLQGQ